MGDLLFKSMDAADYACLGLDPAQAHAHTRDAIRRAYRRRCLLCHPDKQGSAEDFIKLTEAYRRVMQNVPSASADPMADEPSESTLATLMIDFLQSYVVHLLENMVQSKPRPKPVVVSISVSMADVYHERIKKVVVRTRNDAAGVAVPLYIRLDREEFDAAGRMECVYEGKGDVHDGVAGDVVVVAKMECDPGFELHPTRPLDIIYRLHTPLYDYLYGLDHKFVHVSGETVETHLTPLTNDEAIIKCAGFNGGEGGRGDLLLMVTPSFAGLTMPPPPHGGTDFEAWLRGAASAAPDAKGT